MNRSLFLEEAQAELQEAAGYYEERVPGLGQALVADVERAISEIIEHPQASPLVGSRLYRKLLRRFPFSLLYQCDPTQVIIIAVAHHKRRPEYWKLRHT